MHCDFVKFPEANEVDDSRCVCNTLQVDIIVYFVYIFFVLGVTGVTA